MGGMSSGQGGLWSVDGDSTSQKKYETGEKRVDEGFRVAEGPSPIKPFNGLRNSSNDRIAVGDNQIITQFKE